jgi:homoaconitate hydratase
VVASSALAGHITDGGGDDGTLTRSFEERELGETPAEEVDILPGFPESSTGRLVFVPRENLNTDGIYGKDHTYRDLSREEMAAVVMANYDPAFTGRVREGDILVGTRNFGTGSSREQAATALQARGIALIIAESFSQTYLRNAFNNGLICIQAPGFVRTVERALALETEAREATIIPGDTATVDFRRGSIVWREERFGFAALGSVPQALVVAGGVEARIKEQRTTTDEERGRRAEE